MSMELIFIVSKDRRFANLLPSHYIISAFSTFYYFWVWNLLKEKRLLNSNHDILAFI
jgi:hypothetical protein